MGKEDKTLVKTENRRERRAKDKKSASGIDNTFRRTWDKDEYEDKAADREKVQSTAARMPEQHPLPASTVTSGCSAVLCRTQAEQEVEESALDAKRRKRLGGALLNLPGTASHPCRARCAAQPA